MERLTEKDANGHWKIKRFTEILPPAWQACNRLAAYEDTGYEPAEIDEALNEAHDLGYQACLNYKGSTWTEAAELQAYRALGTAPELAAWKQAMDEGRLVVLPCKVGDTIYVIPSLTDFGLNKISYPENNRVYEQTVEAILWCNNKRYLVRTCGGVCEELSDDFGITWFLTRAEAEAALGGGGDG